MNWLILNQPCARGALSGGGKIINIFLWYPEMKEIVKSEMSYEWKIENG